MVNEIMTSCSVGKAVDLSHIKTLSLNPDPSPRDYLEAMRLAEERAEDEITEPMLLSWYDRDRDFESPQHASECHQDSATPGYVDYGIHHGATLMIDIEDGRFVFFYLSVDI